MSHKKQPFFLHIKKSAGSSVIKMLGKHYPRPNDNLPKSFIQIDPKYYNFNLNNQHVLIGEYTFKRAQFAKQFLYEDFNSLYSFAFSRNPIDRILSMFYYLYYVNNFKAYIRRNYRSFRYNSKISLNIKTDFDIFLDYVHDIHIDNKIKYPSFNPFNIHFATHTAPMFQDIAENDNIILTKIFRLENLNNALKEVFESCKIKQNVKIKKININPSNSIYKPSANQIKKIQNIYSKDFDLFESLNI